MSPEEARRRARLEFGSLDSVKDDCREARGLRVLDEIQRDLRHAVRLLRKTPAFTATALATLALCLGANLTIFAVVDSVLLRPLPFPDAGPAGEGVQHLPQGRRARRRLLADQLLRASRPARRVRLPGRVPRRHGDRRRARAPPSASRSCACPRSSSRLSASGPILGRAFTDEETTLSDRRRGHSHGRLLAATARRRPRRDRPHDSRGRAREESWSGSCRPTFSFLSSRARLYFPLSSSPEDRESSRRHSGSSSHMIARLRAGATSASSRSRRSTRTTPLWRPDESRRPR